MCYSENMIKTLTTYEVAELLLADSNANWSRSGALALAEYLEGIEADSGHPMEFDLVAIRCEWTEYPSAVEAVAEIAGFAPINEATRKKYRQGVKILASDALEYLKEKTDVIEFFSETWALPSRSPKMKTISSGVIVRIF